MIVVVGQRGMHLGQSDARVTRYDLVWAQAHALIPDGDVLDLDAMPEDVGLAAAIAGLDPDVLGDRGRLDRLGWRNRCRRCVSHASSLPEQAPIGNVKVKAERAECGRLES